jgi:hypothetical protein
VLLCLVKRKAQDIEVDATEYTRYGVILKGAFNMPNLCSISLFCSFWCRRHLAGLCLVLIFFLCPLDGHGAQLTLSWQPSTDLDVAGYRLFSRKGGQSYDYNHPAWEGRATACTYEFDAVVNTTYCFVVRAFDTAGNESANSNEACWTAPAFVLESLSITGPASVNEGNTAIYAATARFSNGDTGEATNTAVWDVNPATYGSISKGKLTTWAVPRHQVVTITASYTFGLVTKGAQKQITIVDVGTNDADGDGLPDSWESAYGLDPTSAGGANGRNGDFDHDGWTNIEEYINSTDPDDDASPAPTPPQVREVNPHHRAGMDDSTRVPANTSFAVRIEDGDGIDLTDSVSVRFTISDGINTAYKRDLSDSDVVRVIKLNSDPDSRATKLWAVYDRAVDASYGDYAYDKNVSIKVEAKDRRDDWMAPKTYKFNVETRTEHNQAEANSPDTGPLTLQDLAMVDPGGIYDAGIKVTDGGLEGAMILYDSGEPVELTFGPIEELPPLSGGGMNAVGTPMNLQPPTVFTTPVKIVIPCPGRTDVSNLSVYLFNGTDYVLACDAAGHVKAEGWMVPGSRVNHPETSPPSIEIQVHHFTGVQAAALNASAIQAAQNGNADEAGTSGAPGVVATDSGSGGGGGGGCFISTAE